MTEFCPRCTWPLEPGPDVDRLCDACGWFGDQSETLLAPPQCVDSPFLAAVHGLAWFREVCCCEFLAEEYCKQVSDPAAQAKATAQLNRIRAERRSVGHALIERFRTIWSGATARQQLRRMNGVVPWPANWTDRHYNGREPCDLLVGPCSCGAWHTENEDWVRAMLFRHNAEIIDEP